MPRRLAEACLLALLLVCVIGWQASAVGPGGWDNLGDAGTPGSKALNGAVHALSADDPGVLLVGGAFTAAGGNADANRIASWNGSAWSAVSSSTSQISNGTVNAIAYANGMVYAGGTFTNAGGEANADFLAVWDGVSWKPFCTNTTGPGPAITATVNALQIIGSTLYVAGDFADGAGITSADRLVACDLNTGAASSTVVDAAHEFTGTVYALTADSEGRLYAGGGFSNLEGIAAADDVAYRDGGGWHAMGSGGGSCGCAVDNFVRSLAANGTDVYVGTDSTNVAGIPEADHVVRWNGSAWSAMGSNTAGDDGWFPTSAFIYGLTSSGPDIVATGSFQNANGDPLADEIASFDGTTWHPVGSDGAGNGPLNANGLALETFSGQLFAGGSFTSAGGDTQAAYVASFPAGASTLTVTVTNAAGGSGSVSGPGINCPAACSSSYPSGTVVTLTAHPDSGSAVTWHGGGCAATASTCQLTVSSDTSVTASFAPPPGFGLTLAPGSSSQVSLPDCVPVDAAIVVTREAGFTGLVSLRVEGLPSGADAQIRPSDQVPPSEGTPASRTITFSGYPDRTLPRTVVVRATSPGLADRTLTLTVGHAVETATLPSSVAFTPRHLLPGTQITVNGNGFCPGTRVQVGNVNADTGATVSDAHTLTFTVPRLATTGAVSIVLPGSSGSYVASGSLTIASPRNTNGFSFNNYPFVELSLGELLDAFGPDDLFLEVNPCWPLGDCTVNTGVFNPLALVTWGVLNPILQASHGHCFGISRAVEQFETGRKPLSSAGSGSSVWSLPGPDGPSSALNDYLDGQHSLQFSAQFLSAWLRGHLVNFRDQLAKLNTELAAGRDPIVTVAAQGEGHAMLAYDSQPTPTGVDILVYDSNRPFAVGENSDPDYHKLREEGSAIHIDFHTDTWSFNSWTGGDDGSLFIAPQATIPDNPSLPATDIASFVSSVAFGSADGSVQTASASKDAQLLPVLDSHAAANTAGTWASEATTPLEVTMQGVKTGRYSASYTNRGFVGAVQDVPVTKGVDDRLMGTADGTVSFAGGAARGLDLELAHRAPRSAGVWSASIHTQARNNGRDTAGLSPSGTMTYTHDGAGSSFAFTLTDVRRDGGPARFQSGAMRIGAGDRITVTPVGRDLAAVRLQVRTAGGRRRTATMHNHARPPARLTLRAVRIVTAHGRSAASLRATIASLRTEAVAGITFRLMSRSHVVAHHAVAASRVRNGIHTFRWRLPRVAHGSYRLVTDVRVVTTGAQGALSAASVHSTRSTRARL